MSGATGPGGALGADWRRVRQVFEDALDVDAAQREAWLARACAGDESLRGEVRRLLAAEDPVPEFLDPPRAGSLDELLVATPLEGRRLDSYTVLRLLGKGGMGAVYLAEQDAPRRHVALKVLEGLPSVAAVRRFQFEAELLGRLRHPGIAQIYGSGTLALGGLALPYFAMAYVEDARTLLEHARRSGLRLRPRLALFLEACDAVQHGHGHGILHRDLKPANLLVDRSGRCKVIDFGIARVLEGEEQRTQLTRTGELLGTILYLAPERLSSDGLPGDVRGDVYSLGVVLYELVCGAAPYALGKASVAEALRLVTQESPRPPRAQRPDLPADLGWIVQRALEREPERRYATVAALAEDVRRFLADLPVAAGPPSGLYRARKFLRRHRAASLAAVLVLAVLLVAAAREVRSRARVGEAREAAQTGAVRLLSLRQARALEELADEAEELHPALPQRIPDFEDWLACAEAQRSGLAETERVLESLRKGARPATGGGWEFALDVDRWLHDSLVEHRRALAEFFAPQRGPHAAVEERLAFARTITERSLAGPEPRRRWEEAVASIADPAVCPLYGGLRIVPQLGLLPLGRDPASGLWEFAHLRSGAPAQPGADGALVLAEETGIVLVLLPGGAFRMGAQVPDAQHPLGSPNVDPQAYPGEGPVLELSLEPYFLGRFEVTQAQWERVTGENPSKQAAPLHPVERVSWESAARCLARLDLCLPTEAQWECAVRAGTSSPWWFPDPPAPEDWTIIDNLHEPRHLPAGSFPPNPFGLHDMLGNVAEWCRDPAYEYAPSLPRREGDGESLVGDATSRIRRGGNFGFEEGFRARCTRSAQRWLAGSADVDFTCGLRAARPLRR